MTAQCCARRILCAHLATPDSSPGHPGLGCHQISIREWSPALPGTSDLCSAPIVRLKGNELITVPGLLGQLWAPLCILMGILIFSFPWTCGDAE